MAKDTPTTTVVEAGRDGTGGELLYRGGVVAFTIEQGEGVDWGCGMSGWGGWRVAHEYKKRRH